MQSSATSSGFEMEARSSSAMAEYRPELKGIAASSLAHSVSSPSLSVLSSLHHAVTTTPSAAESLAASQQNLKCLLPAYRQAPDYETAIRIKYGEDIAKLLSNTSPANSEPQQPMQIMHVYKPPPPYPYSKAGSNSSPDLAVTSSGPVLPSITWWLWLIVKKFIDDLHSLSLIDLVFFMMDYQLLISN